MEIVFKIGIVVLLIWSVANLLCWLVNLKKIKPPTHYYQRQMDGLWNIVNFIIAIAGLYSLFFVGPLTTEMLVESQQIIATNVFINVIYIAVGAFLYFQMRDKGDRVVGYGTSIMVQGLFLLVLDSFMTAAAVLV